jgi:hypothetical protein
LPLFARLVLALLEGLVLPVLTLGGLLGLGGFLRRSPPLLFPLAGLLRRFLLQPVGAGV